MKILEQIKQDHLEARKAKDTSKLSTLTLLLSDIDNARIKNKGNLADTEVLLALRSHLKKLQAEIAFVQDAGRDSTSFVEAINLVESYLPAPLTREEVEHIILQAMETRSDVASVMKVCKETAAERFDAKMFGPRVVELVNSKCSA